MSRKERNLMTILSALNAALFLEMGWIISLIMSAVSLWLVYVDIKKEELEDEDV